MTDEYLEYNVRKSWFGFLRFSPPVVQPVPISPAFHLRCSLKWRGLIISGLDVAHPPPPLSIMLTSLTQPANLCKIFFIISTLTLPEGQHLSSPDLRYKIHAAVLIYVLLYVQRCVCSVLTRVKFLLRYLSSSGFLGLSFCNSPVVE